MKPSLGLPLQKLLPRASARLRLTVAFALVVLAVGGSIVASVYLVMTYLPYYAITSIPTGSASTMKGAAFAPETGGTISTGISGADSRVRSGLATASPLLGDGVEGVLLGRVTVNGPTEILGLLLRTSLIVFAVVLVIGVFVCWVVAGRVLRPVERVTDAARRAASGSLDHRIALEGPDDEFRRLAETFDDMLDRLERSFHAQRRFAANASHELRTPLATTQAILDVALLAPEQVDAEDLTRKLRETNTKNIETVEALLALSDAQAGATAAEHVCLDALTREIVASTNEAAAERDITVHTAIGTADATGDPTLLRLLVNNLVVNAIRYNHLGGEVWLRTADGSVRVENTGPVVAPDDLPRLTEPFFRSAGRVAGSHGLGLALVEAIATGHGAELALKARDEGGLVVTVDFSRAAVE